MSLTPMCSRILTNEANNFWVINNDLDHKIKNLIIHNIPLSSSNSMSVMKTIGKITSPLIHSALTPTLSHIAIQLNLEDSDFIYIIEYGAYFPKDSQEQKDNKNNYDYYFINKDGARITRLSYNNLESYAAYHILSSYTADELKEKVNELKEKIISGIIANYSYDEVKKMKKIFIQLSVILKIK